MSKSKRVFPYYLYHICRKQDKYNFNEGYIGVARSPRKRWASGGYKQNPHLTNAFRKYDDIIKYVVKIGTKAECLANELRLRPERNIGWNIAKGGGMPPNPKGTQRCVSNLPKEKRRKSYVVSAETKEKLAKASLRRAKEISERMLKNNPSKGKYGDSSFGFKGYYVTPLGIFDSEKSVCKLFNISRPTVHDRCKTHNNRVIKKSRWTMEFYGKTWKDLGWGFIPKDEITNEILIKFMEKNKQ